ncbi:MAG TPA: hypothetical protein VIL71_12040 [Spirillospora sp.]
MDRPPAGGLPRKDLGDIPVSGLHVDVPARTAGVWVGTSCTGLVPALDELWPGWRVEFWEDRYEEQLARCEGAVTVPAHDPVAALDEVMSALERRRGEDPVPQMLETVRLHAGDRKAELNPLFTAHRQVEAEDGEWRALVDAAAELRARLAARA